MNRFCRTALGCLACGVMVLPFSPHSFAEQHLDKLTVISTHRGVWDQTLIEWGIDKGFFKDAGLDIKLVWGGGGSDTLQMLVSGSADVAIGNGFDATIAAFSQGAPLYVVAAEKTGAAEFYWYSKVGSGIKKMKNAAGKKVGFSHPGASTQMIAAALAKSAGIKVDLVPSGGMPANLTAVMSGQIALGWAAVPFGLQQEEKHEIQTVAVGNDIPGVSQQTVRVDVASKNAVEHKIGALKRFFKAYRKTLDWAYSSDEATKRFSSINKVSIAIAKKAVKIGYEKASLALSPVSGVDRSMKEAVEQKLISKPLTNQQIHDLLQYVAIATK